MCVCVYVDDRTERTGTCVSKSPLQSWGSFMIVVSVSRCHVPLSVLFGPPVTSRASVARVSWLLVVASGVIWSAVCTVWMVPVPALVLGVCIAPLMVSSPLWHFPLPAKMRLWKWILWQTLANKVDSWLVTMWTVRQRVGFDEHKGFLIHK